MPPLRPPGLTQVRHFSSTPIPHAKSSASRLADLHSAVPPYPYGPSAWYKQSNFGLYGLQKIRFGNVVSEKNEIKTRRYWRPNVQRKRLWSPALGRYLKLRVTTRVLRTIDKSGGLDEYLLGEKAGRIRELGMGGWLLRWRIMQTEGVKERFRVQRAALGLPAREEVMVGRDGQTVTEDEVEEEIRMYDEQLENEEVDIGEDGEGEGIRFMDEKPSRPERVTR